MAARTSALPLRLPAGGAALASYAALLLALAGLIAAMLMALGDAQRLFDSAAEAQRQISIVSDIRLLAGAERIDRPALDAALDRYRRSITAEGVALGAGSEAQQAVEMRDADRLATLSGDRPAMARLVSAIAQREQREAAGLAAQMAGLRARVGWLVAGLAIAAALAAGLGALGLLTANRRLAAQVSARTADLAAIDRSRRLFFAKASHELRSPVTVMRGEAEVALSGPTDPAALREALQQVVANADFLEHRIGELLGLAQAEDGKISLSFARMDLNQVAAGAAATARSYADSAGVEIAHDLPFTAPAVSGDARWLGQAMLAIIDNAVKFSPDGGTVRIAVDRSAEGATVSISDTGIGVAQAELPRIFDAYYQSDAGMQRGGTGLGLALARWVVEQHKGRIAAANHPAGGCIVTLTLPVAA